MDLQPRSKRDDLTAERLRHVVNYDAASGLFTRRAKTGCKGIIGDAMGNLARDGNGQKRIRIGIDGCSYFAHRLAWLYVTGGWPTEDIDHINGDGSDNRWCNLRAATRSQNLMNRRVIGRHGLKGVEKQTHGHTWAARIKSGDKRIYLGNFQTKEEAHAAYVRAAERLHGEFACDGRRG